MVCFLLWKERNGCIPVGSLVLQGTPHLVQAQQHHIDQARVVNAAPADDISFETLDIAILSLTCRYAC